MAPNQIVTFSCFRYEGISNKWWAFRQMGLAPKQLEPVQGLSFFKLLGSGGKKGFSILPNFNVYGMLAIWDNEKMADNFFKGHNLFQEFLEKTTSIWTVFMHTAKAHGKWDGHSPFLKVRDYDRSELTAVMTRATIHTKQLWRFWRYVPPVSKSIDNFPGCLFSIGVGELPLVQQATFSLWESGEAMESYAYKSAYHKDVVKQTRKLGWYKEELFARFHPYRLEGDWQNKLPLTNYF